jgi:hypothetical protein
VLSPPALTYGVIAAAAGGDPTAPRVRKDPSRARMATGPTINLVRDRCEHLRTFTSLALPHATNGPDARLAMLRGGIWLPLKLT